MAERTPPPVSIVLLVNRISLGMFFFIAGLGKVRGGVGQFYEESFLPNLPNLVPGWFGYAYGHAMPWMELITGLMLLVGLYTRLASAVICFMLLTITMAVGLFPEGGGPFNFTIVMLTLAILLWTMGGGAISVDATFFRRRRRRL